MGKSSVDVWLWLLLVMKPYNRKTNFILHNCGYDAVTAATQIRDGGLGFLDEFEKRRAGEVRSGAVNELKQLCEDNNIQIVTLDDEDYPELLKHIENPPIVLFVQGSLKGLNEQLCIAAVGTRGVSEYSKKCAGSVCGSLAKVGAVIVSGLAVGADSAAHKAALEVGGKTVGVLACGNLVNYPAPSKQLKLDIIKSGGAVISELLPDAKCPQGYFHSRNRMISGLCHGTLVIQAPDKSGSLISAKFAFEQGREVFCIPPCDIFDKDYSGVIPLIRDGAVPVFDYTDIIDAFPLADGFGHLAEAYIPKTTGPETPEVPVSRKKKTADLEASRKKKVSENAENKVLKKPEISPEKLTKLSQCEAEIIKQLFTRPMDEDMLMERTGFGFSEITDALMDLELEGLVERGMSGLFAPVLEGE